MALIFFYDASDLDAQQLSDSLSGTDHHWEFVKDRIEPSNCNPDTEVISVFVSSQVTREVIESLPKLKLIALRSTGFNNVDFEAAEEHGVTIANVPVYGNQTVAEFAFTMLLALQRKLPAILEAEYKQFTPNELTGRDLHGKVMGVVGTGHIGQSTIKIANGFSMEVIAYDAFPKNELAEKSDFKYVELDELLSRADVVSLHVPYLPSTHHIMSEERFGKMKQDAILINTARGELVDSEALIKHLESGHLGGAAIDVVEGESLMNHEDEISILFNKTNSRGTMEHSVEISILKEMPNVIIAPHNAYNTVEAILRINSTTAENIKDFWLGSTPNKVTPPKKPTGKLYVARHGESEWNALGKWTGLTEVHLTEKGFKEASLLGRALVSLKAKVDVAFCSEQIRARETLESMLNAAQLFDLEILTNSALNERDYGDFTGKNKWEVKEEVGAAEFTAIRRGWDTHIPNGENLKMVYERAVPYYKDVILPRLLRGDNVLIVAHGNSNRALIKYLQSISDEEIGKLEMQLGEILIYEIDDQGLAKSSEIFKIDIEPSPKA